MKTLQLLIIIIFTATSAFCQELDHLLTKKQVDCSDISYNSGLYFVKYMNENKIDSVRSILNYWENKCGIREPICRAKILLALKLGQFNDSLLTKGTLSNIFSYQNRMDMIKYSNYYSYDNYKPYYGFIPPGQEFDQYTRTLASSLKENYSQESIEYVFAEFYGDNHDTIFSRIQTKIYKESALVREYDEVVERYVNMPEFHISWITGVWIPTGQLRKLGTHPELGFQAGVKHKKMNYDLIMAFKFLKSPNDYYAKRDGSLELTNHFFGGHIGFDIGRDMYAKNGHEIQIIGGIAADGFDALKEDKENDLKSESVWSYNFNAGLGYRYYTSNSVYLGLRVKYNIVDYTLNDVVDFTGNPITIQFVIGGLNNVFRNDNLKALKYKFRK